MLNNSNNSQEIKTIDDWLLAQMAPKNFDFENPENMVVQHQNAFQEMCIMLEELGVFEPHKLTAYHFYSKVRYFKNKFKKQKNVKRD